MEEDDETQSFGEAMKYEFHDGTLLDVHPEQLSLMNAALRKNASKSTAQPSATDRHDPTTAIDGNQAQQMPQFKMTFGGHNFVRVNEAHNGLATSLVNLFTLSMLKTSRYNDERVRLLLTPDEVGSIPICGAISEGNLPSGY
jgi:hypothetical protein